MGKTYAQREPSVARCLCGQRLLRHDRRMAWVGMTAVPNSMLLVSRPTIPRRVIASYAKMLAIQPVDKPAASMCCVRAIMSSKCGHSPAPSPIIMPIRISLHLAFLLLGFAPTCSLPHWVEDRGFTRQGVS